MTKEEFRVDSVQVGTDSETDLGFRASSDANSAVRVRSNADSGASKDLILNSGAETGP